MNVLLLLALVASAAADSNLRSQVKHKLSSDWWGSDAWNAAVDVVKNVWNGVGDVAEDLVDSAMNLDLNESPDACKPWVLAASVVNGSTFTGALEQCAADFADAAFIVDTKETVAHATDGGIPANQAMNFVTTPFFVNIIKTANYLPALEAVSQASFLKSAKDTTYGAAFDFDSPRIFAAQLFSRTSLSTLLEPGVTAAVDIIVGASDNSVTSLCDNCISCTTTNECCGDEFGFVFTNTTVTTSRTDAPDGWGQPLEIRCEQPAAEGTYEVRCSSDSSNKAMKYLFESKSFHESIPTPDYSIGAKIVLSINDAGDLRVSDSSSDDDIVAVLGCAISALEIYHVGMHVIEGIWQYAASTGALDNDEFLKDMLTMESDDVQKFYAGVRLLTLGPGVAFSKAIPNSVLVPFVAAALKDFTQYDPFVGVDKADISSFAGPIYTIYEQIKQVDFGYGERTVDIYVASDTTVTCKINNLLQLQLLVGLLHTDTFVWQQAAGIYTKMINNNLVTGTAFTFVTFPETAECLNGTRDTTAQYAAIAQRAQPTLPARDALVDYNTWLKKYRASDALKAGLANAFADTECMSCTTWI